MLGVVPFYLAFAVLLQLATAFSVSAADDHPLSVVLADALVTNPVIQASLARAEAAQSRAKVERGALLPDIRASASWGTRHLDEAGIGKDYATRSKQVSVSQPLNLSKDYFRWRSAEALADAELARAQIAIQQTFLDIVDAYLSSLASQERVDALSELDTNLQHQLTATTRMFEEGEGTKGHIATVSARLASNHANVERAQQALLEARERLASLALLPADAILEWPAPRAVTKQSLEQVLEGHPTSRQAEGRQRAQTASLKAASAEIFPDITLTGSTGRESGPPASPDSWENRAAINVSVPLFRGGRTVYGIQAAANEAKASQLDVEGARYEVKREFLSATANLDRTASALAAAGAAFNDQETAIYGARLEYDNGERSLTELLNAEQEYIDARINLATARRDALYASYRLRAAQGDLQLP